MPTLTRFLGTLLLATGLFVGGLALLGDNSAEAGGKGERHPHIHAAVKALHKAKKDLKTAAHDFGGHRVAALAADGEIRASCREKHRATGLIHDGCTR